jgi:hypothetical protein
MGGGTSILLKAGRARPESAKQAEIRLANLWRILRIARFGATKPRQDRQRHAKVAFLAISVGYG